MTFARYFKISSYCMIGCGFAAIASTGVLDWISILLFSCILIGSWFLDTARLRHRVPNWVLNGSALLYLAVFYTDYHMVSRSFILAILHLLLFVEALKLLTHSKDRDYLLLYLISFAQLLIASTLTVSIFFILCFAVFLFSGISTLIVFEMRRSNARMQSEGIVRPFVVQKNLEGTGMELFSPFPAGLLSAMALGIALLIIIGAIPLFFLLPRITFGISRHPSGSTQFISGFSERVELGQIGAIKRSDAIVMRVKTNKSPLQLPSDIKWRGLAFDYYDGRSWTRSDTARYLLDNQGWYYKLEDSAQGENWIHQTFFMEALSTDVVFAAHKVLAISRDVGLLKRDAAKNLYTMQHFNRKLKYSAISDSIRLDPALIADNVPIPPEILKKYLQLPVLDPRIEALARQVTHAAGSKYLKARTLEQYLRTRYTYSLVLSGTPHSRDPLSLFLFDVRRGHCEYFASAMVVMLRQLGIPARLVNGFRSGEYNDIGDNWIVRQYDAHSWTEAYFPPYGWIEFDPTPSEPRQPRSALMHMLSNVTDAIDLWWWEDVVNYDPSKQYQVVGALYRQAEAFQRTLKSMLVGTLDKIHKRASTIYSRNSAPAFAGKWLLWSPGLVLVAFLLIRPLRRRIFRAAARIWHRNHPRAVVANYYQEALDLLEANGFKRNREQTSLEFALSLKAHPAGPSFLGLTRLYNEARFGQPEAGILPSKANSLLRLMRTSLRTYAGQP